MLPIAVAVVIAVLFALMMIGTYYSFKQHHVGKLVDVNNTTL